MRTALTPKKGSLLAAIPLQGSWGKNGIPGDLMRATAPAERAASIIVFAVTPK